MGSALNTINHLFKPMDIYVLLEWTLCCSLLISSPRSSMQLPWKPAMACTVASIIGRKWSLFDGKGICKSQAYLKRDSELLTGGAGPC
jgi:hypothetical protein